MPAAVAAGPSARGSGSSRCTPTRPPAGIGEPDRGTALPDRWGAHHAPKRAEQAAATRPAVLAAARELFTSRGHIATTVGQIAQRAEVNVDTLYAAVGTPAYSRARGPRPRTACTGCRPSTARPVPVGNHLFRRLLASDRMISADLVLQRAAARRLAIRSDTSRSARRYRLELGPALPRRAFARRPRVDSAVLRLRRG